MAKRWSAGDKVLAADLNNSVVPTGAVIPYAGSSAPSDWLLCDGSAVSRTTYATLFTLIGTTYGSGDGSTTFNLPNLKGKIPVGLNSSETEFDTLGETGGAKTHTLTTDEMPSHDHPGTYRATSSGGLSNMAAGQTSAGNSGSVPAQGGGGAHNNLQPYTVLNYIIKV